MRLPRASGAVGVVLLGCRPSISSHPFLSSPKLSYEPAQPAAFTAWNTDPTPTALGAAASDGFIAGLPPSRCPSAPTWLNAPR
eukprot:CAMPEP_0202812708 /NCGR_PEP_ID=MMETSP1389-20130828/4302_1 /ASSEMBLY_ACC=CAM_ASM_000865 /TAXON_ID=302021 /ORGANISM="Rhodomonas sp., Strain CCMP768" /LENGTH=82 /DNA_ID=CAMNT_0049484169 /DNA_START=211 /DNA_END=455 /DNA_ORIENTATION=+